MPGVAPHRLIASPPDAFPLLTVSLVAPANELDLRKSNHWQTCSVSRPELQYRERPSSLFCTRCLRSRSENPLLARATAALHPTIALLSLQFRKSRLNKFFIRPHSIARSASGPIERAAGDAIESRLRQQPVTLHFSCTSPRHSSLGSGLRCGPPLPINLQCVPTDPGLIVLGRW